MAKTLQGKSGQHVTGLAYLSKVPLLYIRDVTSFARLISYYGLASVPASMRRHMIVSVIACRLQKKNHPSQKCLRHDPGRFFN